MQGETGRGRRTTPESRATTPQEIIARFPPVSGINALGQPATADIVPLLEFPYGRGVSLVAVADAIDEAVRTSRQLHFSRRRLSGAERDELQRVLRLIRENRPPIPRAVVPLEVKRVFRSRQEGRAAIMQAIVGSLARTGGGIVIDREFAANLSTFAGFEVVASEQEASAIRGALSKAPDVAVANAYRHAAARLLRSEPGRKEALARVERTLPLRVAPGRPHDPFSPSSELAKQLTKLGVLPREREVFLLYASRRSLTTAKKPPQ